MIGYIVLGVLFLIILLLLIPVRYAFKLEMWKASVRIEALFGIFHKTFAFPESKKKQPAKEEIIENESVKKIESAETEKDTEPVQSDIKDGANSEESENTKRAEEREEEEAEDKQEKEKRRKKKKPSIPEQIVFAFQNGVIEEVLKAALYILDHSFPRKWRIRGTFGTGDPMMTAVIEGMTIAFLPEVTKEVIWKYTDTAYTIEGEGRGRIIPLYIGAVILRLALSGPIRRFWRYRQGGMKDE